jgi:hypothetical protein
LANPELKLITGILAESTVTVTTFELAEAILLGHTTPFILEYTNRRYPVVVVVVKEGGSYVMDVAPKTSLKEPPEGLPCHW